MKEILIIIPSYNYAKYLAEAIESALNQTKKCRVVVVDDGSTDNTQEIVARYPVNYLYQENGGLAAKARNSGIKAFRSKYILPLDADDILETTYAQKAYDFLEAYPDYDIVTVHGSYFGDTTGTIFSAELDGNIQYANNMVYCSMFRRSFYEKVGGYCEKIPVKGIEDWVMWCRGYKLGCKAHLINEPLFRYRTHAGSMTDLYLSKNTDTIINWMRKEDLIK